MCRVYRQLTSIRAGAALTIGNFDGVHAGHQLLVQRVIAAKQQGASAACVILFEPHPRDFFSPSQQPTRIMPFSQKYRVLRDLGVDIIFCLPFNQSFANQPYQLFWQRILEKIQPSYVVLGQDFRFGYKREGSIDYIQAQADGHHYQVEIIADHTDEDARISSTRLRQLLQQQDFLGYQNLTGRQLTWHGKGQSQVVHDIEAYRLSFPVRQFPLDGAYLVQVAFNQSDAVAALATICSEAGGRTIVLYRLDQYGLLSTTALTITWIAHVPGPMSKFECKAQIYRHMVSATQLFHERV